MKAKLLFLSIVLVSLTLTVSAEDDWNDNTATPATVTQTADDWNDNTATPATAQPADDWNDNTTPAVAQTADEPAPVTTEQPAAEPAPAPKKAKSGGFSLWWLLVLLPVLYFFFRKKKAKKDPKAAEPKAEPAEEPKEEVPVAEPESEQPVADNLTEGTPAEVAGTQYYVFVKNKEYGPYTLEQMQGFIAEGRMNKRTKMRTAEAAEWTTAAAFEQLDWTAMPKPQPQTPAKIKVTADDQLKVLVKGQEHGPYTLEQMKGFIAEGRMNKNTKVMLVGKTDWLPASDFEPFFN
ncbi:MAG: DUF4339 domain-containing protein [Paludibacteraceae bacterium]|nr:DUF4339 domain-containing protein [Paludibacteraceae bacterium]